MKHCKTTSQETPLRTCTPSNTPHIWRHPGKDFNGIIYPTRSWRNSPAWIIEDIKNDIETLHGGRLQLVHTLAKIDSLLEDAANGDLIEEDETNYWSKGQGDAGRTSLDPDVCYLRLPQPFYVGEKRCKARVYYCEPDEISLLVSLGGFIKNVDSNNSKSIQNERILRCADRGDCWWGHK